MIRRRPFPPPARALLFTVALLLLATRCRSLTLDIQTAATVKGAYDTSGAYTDCITDLIYKATITDASDDTIHRIFVTIAEGLSPVDKLVIAGPMEFGTGISAQYSSAAGEMLITGVIPVEKAQDLISYLKYIPPHYQPVDSVETRSRLIEVQVEDSAGKLSNVFKIPHLMQTAMRVYTSCFPARIEAEFD